MGSFCLNQVAVLDTSRGAAAAAAALGTEAAAPGMGLTLPHSFAPPTSSLPKILFACTLALPTLPLPSPAPSVFHITTSPLFFSLSSIYHLYSLTPLPPVFHLYPLPPLPPHPPPHTRGRLGVNPEEDTIILAEPTHLAPPPLAPHP